MYRARIVFPSLDGDYVFYSVNKDSETTVREMLKDMRTVLVHAVSVKVQYSKTGDGWETFSAFNDDWSQR